MSSTVLLLGVIAKRTGLLNHHPNFGYFQKFTNFRFERGPQVLPELLQQKRPRQDWRDTYDPQDPSASDSSDYHQVTRRSRT
jgi:hypothetical protein